MINLPQRLAHRALLALCGAALLAHPAAGQNRPAANAPATAQDADRPSNAAVLDNYLHYLRLDRFDLAEAYGKELLDRNLSPQEFVALVEAADLTKFTTENQRAMRDQRMEPMAALMLRTYEAGKLSRARDPEEIARNIQGLTGNVRGRLIAEERLLAAGEYAMPQLLEALLDRSKPELSGAARRVIVRMGRQAVIPLATAAPALPETAQETVVDTIGLIPWKTSLPFLVDLAGTTKNARVKAACERAIESLGGTGGSEPAALYRALADIYYNEKNEVTSFWGEDFQLLWSFNPSIGLVMDAIRTPVYHEAMAMRLTERAMTLESKSGGASPDTLALWVAANFSREIDTPAGYQNPAYAAGRRGADYFAAAAGAGVCQRVLGRAIDDRDTPLARRALAAVERTAGTQGLWSASGRSPLLEALTYPNRRVQYEAALALSASQPRQAFAGSDRVVPTLAGAIRGASAQYAAVVSPDAETYQSVRKMLQGLGYTVLPQARALNDIATPIAEAPAVDLIVTIGLGTDKAPAVVDQVRGMAKLAATPVLILSPSESVVDLRRRYEGDARVAVRAQAAGEAMLAQAARDLVDVASGGPISESEATVYSSRALAALRDLAVSGNAVLNVGDATASLVGALGDSGGATRLRVAEILSRIDQHRAQRALMDAALAASGAERVQLMGLVAESAKRYGNLLEARHVNRVVEIASKGDDAEATGAAALMGALNVSNTELVPLILKGQ